MAKAKDEAKDKLVKIASIDDTSPADVATLMKQISDLREQLQLSEEQRSDAEKRALATAQAQGFLAVSDRPDVPTGKSITAKRPAGYETVSYKDDGRPILKPKWKDVKIPTYFYRIDLPPVGGNGLVINGQDFYHGTLYELDLDSLRSVKEQVYRLWDHERNIRGSNENAYRPKREDRI